MMYKIITIFLVIAICFVETNYSQNEDFDQNYLYDDVESGQYLRQEAIKKIQSVEDFRVNEQFGNAKKNYIKSAINENNISVIVWNDQRKGNDNIYAQLLNSSGEMIGENIKINFPDDGQTYSHPDVTVVNNNDFLIIWQDRRRNYDIYGQLLDEQGNLIGENYLISDENLNSTKFTPTISSSKENIIVTWSDRRNGSLYDIYAQRLNKDGEKIGENFIVNSDSQSVSMYSPVSAIDKEGNFCTIWRAYIDGSYKFFYVVSDSSNEVVSEQMSLTDETKTPHSVGIPLIAKSKYGYFASWYRYYENDYNIIGQFIDSVGQKLDSNFIVNDELKSSQLYPSVTSDSNGNMVVSWYDYRNSFAQIYAQRFENDSLSGENFKISEDELKGSKGLISNSINDSGNFVVSWLDYNDPSKYIIYSRMIGVDNEPISATVRVDNDENSSNETTPKIEVFEDGSYVFVWSDNRNRSSRAYFQLYNNDGSPKGENIAVNDAGTQTNPDVIKNSDGTFFIIWREYTRGTFNQYEIVGQKYFKSGEKIGDKFLVSSKELSGGANRVNGSSNLNGKSVITWERKVSGTTRIYAQKYENNGMAVGENFLVSTDTTINNYVPKVGLDADGNFAIVYYGYDNNNYEIYLSRFDKMGNSIDSTIILNDDGVGKNQYLPDISVNENGEAIVAWYDFRTTNGVYFQKLINIGSADSFEKVDSNISAADYYFGYNTPSISLNDSGEFAISWSEKILNFSDVKFRVFNSDLSPKTDVIYTSKSQDRDQLNSKIYFSNEKIYNVWQDNREPNVGYDIWANVFDLDDLVTNVEISDAQLPNQFSLEQNYPNPFNPTTIIKYSVPASINTQSSASLQLIIYDILGREVKTLVNRKHTPGNYEIILNANDLTSGVYFYTLNVGNFVETKKMILLK